MNNKNDEIQRLKKLLYETNMICLMCKNHINTQNGRDEEVCLQCSNGKLIEGNLNI